MISRYTAGCRRSVCSGCTRRGQIECPVGSGALAPTRYKNPNESSLCSLNMVWCHLGSQLPKLCPSDTHQHTGNDWRTASTCGVLPMPPSRLALRLPCQVMLHEIHSHSMVFATIMGKDSCELRSLVRFLADTSKLIRLQYVCVTTRQTQQVHLQTLVAL